jgi:hypothetical protein
MAEWEKNLVPQADARVLSCDARHWLPCDESSQRQYSAG